MNIRGADAMLRARQKPTSYAPDKWTSSFLVQPLGHDLGRHRPGAAQHRRRARPRAAEGTGRPVTRCRSTSAEERLSRGEGLTLALLGRRRRPTTPRSSASTATARSPSSNANANRLVRALRAPRARRRRRGRADVPNRPEFVEVVAACRAAGFRLTPVNWHLTADEAAYIVDDCEAKALVADARVAAIGARRARRAPACTVAARRRRRHRRVRAYDDALAAEVGDDIDDPTLGLQMLYTSGTTGRPKGVHRPPRRRPAATDVDQPRRLRRGRRRRAPLHRPAVPRRAAGVLARARRSRSACGVVLMDGWDAEETLRLDRRARRHAHAHGPDDVPPAALAARRRARHATTSRRCATCCTAPRRARCR